ncbi:MAG: hypothetical protein IT315_02235 [Anaerolineales bacterium]|nr:hypothetical protein [Anaerolineales bacterium]
MNDQMPSVEEPKKNNTTIIIAAVVVVLLCCCCIAVGLLYTYGDQIFGTF